MIQLTQEHVQVYSLQVPLDSSRERLDLFLAKHIPQLSRSRIQKLIADGFVQINGCIIKQSKTAVHSGDNLILQIPPPEDNTMIPADIPLNILYEDDHILVIDKPAGLVVHPGAGNPHGTLANALLQHCGENLSGIGGVKRPGIVHRLDKDTSGLMVVAKTDEAHQNLTQQFQARTIGRQYLALVWGVLKNSTGIVDKPIGRHRYDRQRMAIQLQSGKEARTDYQVLQVMPPYMTLVECSLHSGRTHQIRLHMSSLGHGVVGDPVYGKALPLPAGEATQQLKDLLAEENRQALHAYKIYFLHPQSKKQMKFETQFPKYLDKIIHIVAKI